MKKDGLEVVLICLVPADPGVNRLDRYPSFFSELCNCDHNESNCRDFRTSIKIISNILHNSTYPCTFENQ